MEDSQKGKIWSTELPRTLEVTELHIQSTAPKQSAPRMIESRAGKWAKPLSKLALEAGVQLHILKTKRLPKPSLLSPRMEQVTFQSQGSELQLKEFEQAAVKQFGEFLPSLRLGISELPPHPSGCQRDYIDDFYQGKTNLLGYEVVSATYGDAMVYPEGFRVGLSTLDPKETVLANLRERAAEQEQVVEVS